MLEKFEADPETETIVLVGEIGGDEEEKAARYVAEHMSKPVFSYIAGFSAPPGKTMGHAGAIISGSSGTAQAKKDALEAVGIKVGTTPTEVAELVVAAGLGDFREPEAVCAERGSPCRRPRGRPRRRRAAPPSLGSRRRRAAIRRPTGRAARAVRGDRRPRRLDPSEQTIRRHREASGDHHQSVIGRTNACGSIAAART